MFDRLFQSSLQDAYRVVPYIPPINWWANFNSPPAGGHNSKTLPSSCQWADPQIPNIYITFYHTARSFAYAQDKFCTLRLCSGQVLYPSTLLRASFVFFIIYPITQLPYYLPSLKIRVHPWLDRNCIHPFAGSIVPKTIVLHRDWLVIFET